MVLASVASADEFGGWTFKPPAGYKSETTGDHFTLTKFTGKTFCQFVIYPPRARTDNDRAFEWEQVVATTFPTITAKKPVTAKTKNLTYVATTADVADGNGNKFAITHYVVLPTNAVSSVLAVSNTTTTLAKCPSKAFLDSLSLTAPAAAPVTTTTAAPADSFAGVWATSATASNLGMSLGSQKRQYSLNTDGTYRYYSEAWGGHSRSTWYYIVDESGKWTQSGDQLTIIPAKATSTEYDGGKKKTLKLATAKVTLTARKVYMDGIQEWNLVLSGGGDRDGLLSDRYKPEWKYPPN